MKRSLFWAVLGLLVFGLTNCDRSGSNTTDNNEKNQKEQLPPAPEKAPEGSLGAKKRSFHFTYTAQINKPQEGAKKQKVWIPIPQTNGYQEISNLKLTCPQIEKFSYHTETEMGNKMAYAEVENPSAELTITLEFDCVRYEHSRNNPPKNPEAKPSNKRFLEPTRLVIVDDSVKAKAKELSEGKKGTHEKIKAFYDEVMKTVKYGKPEDKKGKGDGSGWGDGATKWAREQCIGNCTDFHAYFLSLCYASQIPARFEIGAYLLSDKNEGTVGYHCWALAWADQWGWFPVDISEGWKGPNSKNKPELEQYYFGNHCVDRVQFTIGRDVNLNPKQEGGKLNYFIYPYSEADGKLVPTTAKFQFKDL